VFAKDPAGVEVAFAALRGAVTIGERLMESPLPLISHRVTQDGVQTLGARGKAERPAGGARRKRGG
jgi:hypothetical protein